MFKKSIITSLGIFAYAVSALGNPIDGKLQLAHDTLSVPFHYDYFEEARLAATESGKDIFIYVSGDGWNYCDSMIKNVFTDSTVLNYYQQHFVNVHIHATQQSDSLLHNFLNVYGIQIYPCYLLVDTAGEIIHRNSWMKNANEMIAFGETATDSLNCYNAVRQRIINRQYSREDLMRYLDYSIPLSAYMDNGYNCEQQFLLDKYFAALTPDDYLKAENWDMIMRYVVNPESLIFQYLLENSDKFYPLYHKEIVDAKIIQALSIWTSGDVNSSRYIYANKVLRTLPFHQAKALVENNEKDKLYYSNINDFSDNFDTLYTRYNYAFYHDIYRTAWQIYNYAAPKGTDVTPATIDKAIAWLGIMIKYNNDVNSIQLQAQLHYLRGRKKKSAQTIDMAIKEAIRQNQGMEMLTYLDDIKQKIANGTLQDSYVDLNKSPQ